MGVNGKRAECGVSPQQSTAAEPLVTDQLASEAESWVLNANGVTILVKFSVFRKLLNSVN